MKEEFDRDTRRLALERERLEAERVRNERLLWLELLRQGAERETSRLRLVAGIAVASWLGTLFLAARRSGGTARWASAGALLLAALASAFAGLARVGRSLDRMDARALRLDEIGSGVAGAVAPWLVITCLAVIGVALLITG